MASRRSSSKIYLDYAASTPVDPRVLRAMMPYFSERFGNPGSLHSFGQEAIAAVDHARETIAKSIGANFREIIFVGSATEANNLALRGTVRAVMENVKIKDKNDADFIEHSRQSRTNTKLKNDYAERGTNIFHFDFSTLHFRPKVVVSAIEHESVLETARDLERDGIEVIYLPVNRNGVVNIKKLEAALDKRTVLVSVMYANNEIGTIQPIAKILEMIQNFRKELRMKNKGLSNSDSAIRTSSILNPQSYPLLHVDAVQAFQFFDCNVNALGIDLMTLSAHKIYGPKGIGALYVRQKLEMRNEKLGKRPVASSLISHISPLLIGGGQEFGLRSGTENVPQIVGFGKAVELATRDKRQATRNIGGLKNYFWRELKKICPRAQLNGASSTNNEPRANKRIRKLGSNSLFADVLPNILNVYFPDHEAEYLLTKLDLNGLAASAGSACAARSPEPSHVLSAIGLSKERALRSVRVSFGRPTTKAGVKRALAIFKNCL